MLRSRTITGWPEVAFALSSNSIATRVAHDGGRPRRADGLASRCGAAGASSSEASSAPPARAGP
eukprot:3127701-Pyramimonas_sp.AAC.1